MLLYLQFYKLEGIPALIVYAVIGSVVANIIYIAGTSFLPEFKPAVNFLLKLAGLKRKKKQA